MIKNTQQNNKKVGTKARMLWAMIITLTVVQIVTIAYVIKLWSYTSSISEERMSTLVNQTEERRYKFPVIDVATDRVYIPEVRVYLPLNEVTRNMKYDYFNTQNHKALYLSLSSIIGRQTEHGDPSCDKLVWLTNSSEINNPDPDDLVGTIQPTKDGLTNIYRHRPCEMYGQTTMQEDLIQSVKMIQQY